MNDTVPPHHEQIRVPELCGPDVNYVSCQTFSVSTVLYTCNTQDCSTAYYTHWYDWHKLQSIQCPKLLTILSM